MVNWKAVGIISIIINILIIVLFVWAYNIGSEIEEMEYECSYICTEAGAILYFVDEMNKCLCYDSNQEIIKMEDLR